MDRTWKSGRVSFLGNVKLAKFTYFFWIYRGLMCQSWKRWIIEGSLALLNPSSHCCQSSSIWGRSISKMEKFPIWAMLNWKSLLISPWVYRRLMSDSWQLQIIVLSRKLLNELSHFLRNVSCVNYKPTVWLHFILANVISILWIFIRYTFFYFVIYVFLLPAAGQLAVTFYGCLLTGVKLAAGSLQPPHIILS